jgi:TolA-binding protein
MLAGGRLEAAGQAELNAWKAAGKFLRETMWAQAEVDFSEFIKKYPNSEYYADAVLCEAQARFHLAGEKAMNQAEDRQWSYKDVISLLASQQSHADDKADRFAYWTAEAGYAGSNFTAAAEAYGEFTNRFTGSDLRSEALFKEADARLQLGDTARVVELLRQPGGAFQQVAKSSPADPWVARGLFLLAETELAGRDYAAAADALSEMPPQKQAELEWKRQYLLCRVRAEGGHPEEALQGSADLLAAAGANPVFKAESYQMLGDIYRGLERFPEAIAAYQTNLSSDLPLEEQRRAALSIFELNLRQNQPDAAAHGLGEFLDQHPNETNSDFDLLALGELRLRQHFQAAGDTIFLRQAETNFQRLDTNSDFWGKAQLNLGWCLWVEGTTNEGGVAFSNLAGLRAQTITDWGKIAESGVAFSNAVGHLPHNEDQAVALFKLADTQYLQTNHTDAIRNYSRIIDEYASPPSVTNSLFEPALYQTVQAATAQTNLTAASGALGRILEWFPNGLLAQPGMLLLGEAEDRAGKAAEARKIFSDFIARWPESPMKPDADLAIARTYERENDWTNAINRLYSWVAANTNAPALPQAEFQLAWANYKAGNDPQAFSEFTNFVAKYPANVLAGQAQLWMGYYYFQKGLFDYAEVNFQGVFATNTPATQELQNQARMMAGKAAVARGDFNKAIENYFEKLKEDSNNCPADLRLMAQFAWGDALKSSTSLTNLSPCQHAIQIFGDIATNHPGDPLAPLAWGKMGDCYLQLGAANDTNQDWFGLATNAYGNVITSSNADLATRCTAEYGIGQVLEKMAQAKPAGGKEREQLLRQAVDHYLNVVNGSNLRDGESQRDPYLVQLTGLDAARIETDELKDLDKALNLYQTLRDDLPPLQGFLDKKIANLRNQMANPPNRAPAQND